MRNPTVPIVWKLPECSRRMVFLLDRVIEYFTANPQDVQTLIVILIILIVFLGLDYLLQMILSSKIIIYFNTLSEDY
ncbi:hypothetical protein B5X24_HaOG202092 [Helicoverpa armigera]|uniref:Uncharacterized protein n=1 Tax=Helicoverpa armigera TaxID=29058 RepID=A0A2W1C0N8_HELAM|nr:hypothetical protein B5X24_HaOG202092 [Helicoverpa armigera]